MSYSGVISALLFREGVVLSCGVAFADASDDRQATDRKSVSGGVITCAGACVCWYTRMQRCLTLSTSEIEEGIFLYYYSVVVSPVNFVIHGFLEGYSNSFTHTREKERGAYHGL